MSTPNYEIILDFDDVIYPFCQGIMAVLAEEGITGTITQWALENDFGLDRVAFWDMIYQPKHNETLFMQPIPLATLAQMRRLRYAGHRLHIVTARTNPTSERFAMDVIRRDNVPVDSITFTKNKAPMVNELDASFSLDDGPHNYEAFHLNDHLTFLMDAPHNQHVTEFPSGRRVSDITDFANTVIGFQEHGVQLRGAAA
jgi:5'(3')-deoxyribonucleotidase